MPKNALRTRMLAARNHLSEEEQLCAASLVLASLTTLPEYVSAVSVALYAAFRGELPTSGIIRQSLAAGKKVFLPAVEKSGLVFRKINGEADLSPGKYGIPEPGVWCEAATPEAIDLFVIPGVAFDLHGHRVGYGRGYYDKALHRFESGGKLIGIGYDFQLVDEIAGEPHDVIMDRVITERRAITPVLLK